MAAVMGGAAAFERFRSYKSARKAEASQERAAEAETKQAAHNEIVAAKNTLIELAKETSKKQEERYIAEHEELVAYRKEVHERQAITQATLLKQAEEIAVLNTKTDMTPVLQFIPEQREINAQVLESFKVVLTELKRLKDTKKENDPEDKT